MTRADTSKASPGAEAADRPKRSSTKGRRWAWALVGTGVVLSLVAGGLYSDLLGLTDFVLVESGYLSFRLPLDARTIRTPIATGGLWAAMRRAAPYAIALGSALIGTLVWFFRARSLAVLHQWPRGVRGAAALALLGCTMAAFLPVGYRGGGLAVYFVVATAGFTILVLGLASTPSGLAAGRAVAGIAERVLTEGRGGRVTMGLAVATLVATASIALAVFGGTPHVVDGVSQLFQARIFATGRLYLPSHALSDFFDLDTVVNTGRWFSQYTPAHAGLLLVGDQAGVPWLVNPLLGAATVPVVHALGTATHDQRTGRLSALLLMLSPFFLLVSSEFYNHASALFFLALFLLHYVRYHEGRRLVHALGAGAWLGMATMSRPLTALAFAVPVALHGIGTALRGRETRRITGYLMAAGATLTLVAVLLVYNRLTTGAALTFGYDQASGPGFGFDGGVQWMRSLTRVIALNNDLLGWPVPALLLPLLAFLSDEVREWDYLWVAIFFSLLVAYSTTRYADTEFGPRYLYEATAPLLLLSSRGLLGLRASVRRLLGEAPDRSTFTAHAGVAIGAAVALALCLSFPARLAFYASPRWHWAVPDEAIERIQAEDLDGALVFVSGESLWNALFLENPFELDSAPVIYAQDLGERNAELARYYPGRVYFVADSASMRPIVLP